MLSFDVSPTHGVTKQLLVLRSLYDDSQASFTGIVVRFKVPCVYSACARLSMGSTLGSGCDLLRAAKEDQGLDSSSNE